MIHILQTARLQMIQIQISSTIPQDPKKTNKKPST